MGFWTGMGGALVSGIGSLLGGGFQRRQQKFNLQKQIDWERESFNLQKAESERRWHMSNLYNSPVQQMSRLKAAGLNPRLIYGSSGATGGISSPAPTPTRNSPDFSQVKALPIGDGISSYVDTKMKLAQIDAIEQQTSLAQQKEANEAVRNAIFSAEAANARGYFA